MKKFFYLALPMMVVGIVALGYGESGETPTVVPKPETEAFGSWCRSKLGDLQGAQCVTQLSYRYSRAQHKELWKTDIHIEAHDTVTVSATGAPTLKIGQKENALPASGTIVADADGLLSFTSAHPGKFSVTEIHLKRCFRSIASVAPCASEKEAEAIAKAISDATL